MEKLILYDIQEQPWIVLLPVNNLIVPLNDTVAIFNQQKLALCSPADCVQLENRLYTINAHYQALLRIIHQGYYKFLSRFLKPERTENHFTSLRNFASSIKKEAIWLAYKIALYLSTKEHYFFERFDKEILALKDISLTSQEIQSLGNAYIKLKRDFGLSLTCLDSKIIKTKDRTIINN